jgi:hypothetical protein
VSRHRPRGRDDLRHRHPGQLRASRSCSADT